MISALSARVERLYGCEPLDVKPLGGGFYGRVFRLDLPVEPYRLVAKVYLIGDLAAREKRQIDLLRRYATLSMPETICVLPASDAFPHEVLTMRYLEGVNAGIQTIKDAPTRARIGEQVIDNLIAYHTVAHPQGFGEPDAPSFTDDFRAYYKPIARVILSDARALYQQNQLPRDALDIALAAFRRFDDIFCLPIREARLIHGDYNMWNILLDDARQNAVAAFDPFGCGWFDREFDLYQLDNANGKAFGLLDRYRRRMPVSENFEIKRRFYELFTEIRHFARSGVDASSSALPEQAENLHEQMALRGIPIN